MGAVPVLARGLGHTAPTYLRRRPGSPSNGLLGSALYSLAVIGFGDIALTSTHADPKAALRREALARRRAVEPAGARGFQPSPRRRGHAARAALASRDRLRLSSDPRRARHARALAGARRRRIRDRVAGLVGRGRRSTFRLWRPGEPTRPGRCRFAEPLEAAPAVEPDLLFVPLACFDRRGHRIGYGAGYYDRTLARLARIEARSCGRRRLRGLRSRRRAVRGA